MTDPNNPIHFMSLLFNDIEALSDLLEPALVLAAMEEHYTQFHWRVITLAFGIEPDWSVSQEIATNYNNKTHTYLVCVKRPIASRMELLSSSMAEY